MKYLFYLYCLLLLFSCSEKKSLIIKKLDLPSIYCANNSCTEAYTVANIDLSNSKDLDSLNSFICRYYSKIKVKQNQIYQILFYKFDESGDTGLNEKLDFNKELIEWHSESLLLAYTWQREKFIGITTYYKGDNAQYYQPVPKVKTCSEL